MQDPTYVKDEIYANPAWKLAFMMSEIDNDLAPIGWGQYISLATNLLNSVNVEYKNEHVERLKKT